MNNIRLIKLIDDSWQHVANPCRPASPSTPDLHHLRKPRPVPCGFSSLSTLFLLSCFFISFPSSVLLLPSSCAPHPHVSLIEHLFSPVFFSPVPVGPLRSEIHGSTSSIFLYKAQGGVPLFLLFAQ